jgi:cytosine/creatinine deaminase
MTMPSGIAAPGAGVMSEAERSVLLGGVTLAAGQVVDVRLHGGSIAEVGPPGTLPPADEHLDLTGYLLLPAPAEPHAHFDTALTADHVDNPTGDLPGAIQAWLDYQGSVTRDDFVRRATEAAKLGLANGTTAIRSHVGIYQAVGTKAVEALLEVREALRGLVDIQLVALNVRLTGPDCADMRALLRAAMEMGVDVVGGCPHLDPDPVAYHNLTLSLASELGRPIDLHTDENLDPTVLHLPHLADLVAETGFPYGATASHCVSLGVQPPEVAARVAERVAAARVAVICNPQTNLGLQARRQRSAPPRGLTALRPLLEAGVTVAAGGDNLRDPFNPVGRADPLETASLLVAAGHLTPEEAYAAVSAGARSAMGLPEVQVEAGFPAELLAIRAASLGEAIAGGTSRVVIHQGRVVSRTTVTREFPSANGTALAGDHLLL